MMTMKILNAVLAAMLAALCPAEIREPYLPADLPTIYVWVQWEPSNGFLATEDHWHEFVVVTYDEHYDEWEAAMEVRRATDYMYEIQDPSDCFIVTPEQQRAEWAELVSEAYCVEEEPSEEEMERLLRIWDKLNE